MKTYEVIKDQIAGLQEDLKMYDKFIAAGIAKKNVSFL